MEIGAQQHPLVPVRVSYGAGKVLGDEIPG